MLYTGSIFAPPKPGSALRGMYYLAAWGALVFFRMPLVICTYCGTVQYLYAALYVSYEIRKNDIYIIYVGDANADDHPPGSTDQMAQISKDWDPNLVKKAPTSVNLTLYLVR